MSTANREQLEQHSLAGPFGTGDSTPRATGELGEHPSRAAGQHSLLPRQGWALTAPAAPSCCSGSGEKPSAKTACTETQRVLREQEKPSTNPAHSRAQPAQKHREMLTGTSWISLLQPLDSSQHTHTQNHTLTQSHRKNHTHT